MTHEKAAIAYWMVNYAPRWEAASKEIDLLFDAFAGEYDVRVLGLNLRGKLLDVRGPKKRIPLPLALGLPLLLRWLGSSVQLNHVFASAGERIMLPWLSAERTVLTIAKQSSLEAFERNFRLLKQLRYVVVESEFHRDLLRQGYVSDESIRLIYPGASIRAYRPATGAFKILFATSPFQKNTLVSRGVHLMVRAARELPDVQFILVWRVHHQAAVQRLVQDAGASNVEIRSGYIPDMGAVYDSAHATILPGLSYDSLKPSPQSAIDSLAHGKPLLVSRPTSIAGIVEKHACGVVFDPEVDALRDAVLRLRDAYEAYQANCHSTVEQTFSPHVFLERYRALYRLALGG